MMEVIIFSSNTDVSEESRKRIEEKFQKLNRFFDRILRLKVEVKEEKKGFRVEATAELPRQIIRAEKTRKQLQEALDLVYAKLQHQIRRYKKFLVDRKRQASSPTPAFQPVPEEVAVSFHPEFIRRKLVDLKPMTEEEAALQMEMLGHDFYLFLNEKTHQVNVVYKRKDGQYGLIESIK